MTGGGFFLVKSLPWRWCRSHRSHRAHFVKVGFGFRIAGRSHTGALDPGSMHVRAQVGTSAKKEFMVVGALVGARPRQSTESVEIQLTLKAGNLGLSKETRHHVLYEGHGIMDTKGSSVGLPRNNLLDTQLFDTVQHGMQDNGEGCRNASTGKWQNQGRRNVISIVRLVLWLLFGLVMCMIVIIVLDESSWVILGCESRIRGRWLASSSPACVLCW
mmetsp:Transcript_13716/g.31896  ORF Transcript_13716/g.31896 Transcript_13716/m.31896 type:complete len:216 (-) Transcript_13716:386-1033(-)